MTFDNAITTMFVCAVVYGIIRGTIEGIRAVTADIRAEREREEN